MLLLIAVWLLEDPKMLLLGLIVFENTPSLLRERGDTARLVGGKSRFDYESVHATLFHFLLCLDAPMQTYGW